MIDIRVRTEVRDVSGLLGQVLGPRDYDVLLTGPCYVRTRDNRALAVYLPGALADLFSEQVYEVLHSLRSETTSNRGAASGTLRLQRGNGDAVSSRTETVPIASTVIGAMDPAGQRLYCRLTSWTGRNLPAFALLHPLLQHIGALFAEHVPDRYAVQAAAVADTAPEWVIPGTPFTTVTVNNTYPTGVHVDKGDLQEGFSTLACLRRGGPYTGGQLVFPQHRVAVDMRHGDVLLMDAHQWHGNVPIVCGCPAGRLNGPCPTCAAERISLVSYYRTKMRGCGTAEQEMRRASDHAAKRSRLPG